MGDVPRNAVAHQPDTDHTDGGFGIHGSLPGARVFYIWQAKLKLFWAAHDPRGCARGSCRLAKTDQFHFAR